MKKITYFFVLMVFILVLINISLGIELIEGDVELEPSASWPEDLSTSSQVVFRPLFVYKQKKAVLDERNRRKSEVAVVNNAEKHLYNHYKPNYYYEPYLSYYYNHHHYHPYYYNYYSHNHYNPYDYRTGG